MAYVCDGCGTLRADDGNCVVCGGASVSEYEVAGGEEYVCDECGDSFDSKQGIRNHERSHEDDEGDEDEEE